MDESDRRWTHHPAGDMIRDVVRALDSESMTRETKVDLSVFDESTRTETGRHPVLMQSRNRPRSVSPHPAVRRTDSVPPTGDDTNLRASDLAQPGGFRRQYIFHEAGNPPSTRDGHAHSGFIKTMIRDPFLYARFGLYTSTSDDDDHPFSSEITSEQPSSSFVQGAGVTEAEDDEKKAYTWQTVLTILKSFVCSAFLVLPRGFSNGGFVFSLIAMSLSFCLSMYAMTLLVRCCTPGRESFGAIAQAALGRWGCALVNLSVVVSQLGFCAVAVIFVAANVMDLALSLNNCSPVNVAMMFLVFSQIPLYAPVSWVRRIKYFGPLMLFADGCLLFALGVVLYYVIGNLMVLGPQPAITIINPRWHVFLGTSVYMWEGVGLVLPIRASMQENLKPHFEKILFRTLLGVFLLYLCYSSLAYLAYGDAVKDIILMNLPENKVVYFMQGMYTLAISLTFPLMLFPASRILERGIFDIPMNLPSNRSALISPNSPATGHVDPNGGAQGPPAGDGETTFADTVHPTTRKWVKNIMRSLLVCLTIGAAWFGITELDNFIAVIGSLCCVPLVFIFPPLLHLKLSPGNPSWKSKMLDRCLIAVGLVLMVFTTYLCMSSWHHSQVQTRCDILHSPHPLPPSQPIRTTQFATQYFV